VHPAKRVSSPFGMICGFLIILISLVYPFPKWDERPYNPFARSDDSLSVAIGVPLGIICFLLFFAIVALTLFWKRKIDLRRDERESFVDIRAADRPILSSINSNIQIYSMDCQMT